MNKAVFLDRDGVINIDNGYVYRPEHFYFTPHIFEACKILKQLDYLLIIVTNQSGIARGYYSKEDFHSLTRWMMRQFAANAVEIDDVLFCPYHPDGKIPAYCKKSEDRKPRPGMINRALAKHNIARDHSLLVGDKLSDIEAAYNAGLTEAIFIGNPDELTEDFKTTPIYRNLMHFVANRFLLHLPEIRSEFR